MFAAFGKILQTRMAGKFGGMKSGFKGMQDMFGGGKDKAAQPTFDDIVAKRAEGDDEETLRLRSLYERQR